MSIAVPQGFQFAGVHCGIKSDATKEDLTLIVADRPSVAAAVYTTNKFYAAPVAFDRQRTPMDRFRVLVANSGNANACTGEQGLRDAEEMARLAERACGAEAGQGLVMSTGIIGERLPMEKIAAGVADAAGRLAGDEPSYMSAARGILTTDNGHKVAVRTVQIAGREVRIAGMVKGAGMISPKMATMLSAITTDAMLTPQVAQQALFDAVDRSFNCISVEGDMSTNDTVMLLAGGAQGEHPLEGDDLAKFQAALAEVCVELARMIPNDGEGASHLITVEVLGCASREDARRIAKVVANSVLTKTGMAGADPNWGRILAAVGSADVSFDPAGVELSVNGTLVFSRGAPVEFDAAAMSDSIRGQREVHVLLRFSEGDGEICFWTSDLNTDYVRFNADYHT